jgi:molybdopterin/thiamine biosynthesis adenylyltransferase
LEQSNLNRFIGATPRVTGKPKAHLLKKFMKDFNPKAMVKADISKFPHGKSMELLAECDIMVGCVDNDHSRLTLQLFSLALGKPLFDMGSGIYLSEGATLSPQVEERGGQVRIAIPGRGCLACMGLATSGIRDFNWQAHNKERGYIIGTGMTPPSVITLNQVVASLCLNSLVDYITGVGLGSFFIKYDEMNQSIRKVDFTKDPHCPVCSG